uniref:Uncharacterized protein n=1 Tax=Ditylenchus dipsaci TaxID=166011 RepID=A0A915DL31_9BILA
MYTENYHESSKWIAFAVNKGLEEWRKLTKLPDMVDQLANSAFAKNARRQWSKSTSSQKNDIIPANDLKQVVQEEPVIDKKISEVLALIIEREDDGQMAVLYTQFGLARHQNNHPVGTWMKYSPT